jgi:hypothetical protein
MQTMNDRFHPGIRMLPAGIMLLLAGCAMSNRTSGSIRQYGAMRQVMREAQTQPRFPLIDAAYPRMYGVGAMAGLRGEVTIDDGRVWITQAASGELLPSGPTPAPDDHATLLTVAHISRWHERTVLPVEGELEGKTLEEAIRTLAAAHALGGRDAAEFPLVFTIDTQAAALELHVVDGFCPHTEGVADAARLRVLPGERVRIIGIHAPGREGELTHHGTALHAHAILTRDGRTLTAHIDSLRVGAGSVLRVGE